MNKSLGIGILTLCFGLSSVNVSLATQVIEEPPIIVQPYDLSTINQQIFEIDRESQEQALAIKGLMNEKINKVMADSQIVSKYDELIKLTEIVDDMKSVEQSLEPKREVIEKKYKILTDLKNEMALELPPIIVKTINNQQQTPLQATPQPEQTWQVAPGSNPTTAAKIKEQENQIAILNTQLQELSSDLKIKDESIGWLNLVMAVAKNKAEYYQLTSQLEQISTRQIQGEVQHIKDDFALDFKDHDYFEKAIVSFKNQAAQLGLQLSRKQEQVDLLKNELENKITEVKDRDDQITTMKAKIQAGQRTKEEADSLKQQLAAQQDKVDQLNQQLDNKTAESDKMTLMIEEYQQKLESKNNATNEQLKQILTSNNYQAQMEKQMADLNTRLQEKEAQVIKIKKDLYDLQELTGTKDRESQAKDLSFSITQQKVTDLKTALDSARQQLAEAKPSSDELEFLRTGLTKATAQLKQKDEDLLHSKANADEYEKEFKKQAGEFQGLQDQLFEARGEIKRKDEDEKALQAQLKTANIEIKDLKAQLRALSKNDPFEETLTWALDKIDEQSRQINTLIKKLQDRGKSVDLTKDTGEP
jgi:DNA repair exonuclease SbcCD ATPase subunit